MFYDFEVEVYKETVKTNNIGQDIPDIEPDYSILCDVQPSSDEIIKKTFGEAIESDFIIFADERLNIGTVIKYNFNFYKINKIIDWVDYKIYSIVGCDDFD